MTTCLSQDATTCLHRRATTCLPASFRREAGGGLPRFLFCQRLTYTAGRHGAPDTTGLLLEHFDVLHECITQILQWVTMMQRKGNKQSWCQRRQTTVHTQQTLSSQKGQASERTRKDRASPKRVRKPQYISLKDKWGKEKTRELLIWHNTSKQKKKELSDVQITTNGRR